MSQSGQNCCCCKFNFLTQIDLFCLSSLDFGDKLVTITRRKLIVRIQAMEGPKLNEKLVNLCHRVEDVIGNIVSEAEIDEKIGTFNKYFLKLYNSNGLSIANVLKKDWVHHLIEFKRSTERKKVGRP